MFLKQVSRFFNTGKYLCATDKNALSALRKKTGYTFANCKKALELHNNDLIKAEEWLKQQAQALGWSKATKLEGRSTKQGLVGVLVKNNIGAMVEVNCETDFVARNEHFQKFVENASIAITKHADNFENNGYARIDFNNESLKSLKFDDGKSLSDHLALMIGTVGENATLRRAICFKVTSPSILAGYAHPADTKEVPLEKTLLGKYGALVAFKSSQPDAETTKNLCQHIVGMNPQKIGDKDSDKPNEVKDDECCLIHQEFLLDPSINVDEFLESNKIEVIDFQRFECGENLAPESQPQIESAASN